VADLPYVLNNGKLPAYFEAIQKLGVPTKANQPWLEAIGFKGKNDRYLVSFLRALGFVDTAGAPTDVWLDYRHVAEGRAVLGRAIQTAYSDLFQLYPDAHRRDGEAIRNWMRTAAPKASPNTVDRAVNTFRELVKLADFDDGEVQSTTQATAQIPAVDAPVVRAVSAGSAPPGGVVINLNVELQLPTSASADDYENFFAAMRKHLIDGPASDS
jgi:hypothetical protein